MELKNFIKESLFDIHSGLKEVNKKLSKNYGAQEKKNIFLLKPGSKKEGGTGIHFDIAVAVKQETEGTKKGKFAIKVIEAGLGKTEKNFQENISRLQFTVNVTTWAGTYK